MGLFIDNPKPMERNMAILVLILNIIPLPGIGTVIYNVITKDDKWINAIGQILLSWIIIGLIWAIIDGVKILQAAKPSPGGASSA